MDSGEHGDVTSHYDSFLSNKIDSMDLGADERHLKALQERVND